jgi:hypothetical protein
MFLDVLVKELPGKNLKPVFDEFLIITDEFT